MAHWSLSSSLLLDPLVYDFPFALRRWWWFHGQLGHPYVFSTRFGCLPGTIPLLALCPACEDVGSCSAHSGVGPFMELICAVKVVEAEGSSARQWSQGNCAASVYCIADTAQPAHHPQVRPSSACLKTQYHQQ